ncbi:MAG: DNA recombination protein RmuC [Desulfobacterales bacterium]
MELFPPLTFSAAGVLAVLLALVVLIFLTARRKTLEPDAFEKRLRDLEQLHERTERTLREELGRNREEAAAARQRLRQEIAVVIRKFGEGLQRQLERLTGSLGERQDQLRGAVEERLARMLQEAAQGLDRLQGALTGASGRMREETGQALKSFNDTVLQALTAMSELQKTEFAAFAAQLERLSESHVQRIEALRQAVEENLSAIQQENRARLEDMRRTVEEKLEGTLEKRLGESFRQVSERLEQVHRGLGEMQALAAGVGDLKRMLANVKTRGTWGEVQLGALLSEVLAAEQFAENVATKEGGERVEFAIRLPGRGEEEEPVLLPIDAKFPLEDYLRLTEAQERADAAAAEEASRGLEIRIRQCAADIARKYLNPPRTTDFAILFLPTEGLFAEVVRRPGLAETVQRESRVVIAGPTTLWSILTSLQMGFRTLAIEKRSSEVWKLLAAVKTEWGRYGEILQRVQRKLQEASSTIEKAERRSRVIGRRLREVEELPPGEAQGLLGLQPAVAAGDEDRQREPGAGAE